MKYICISSRPLYKGIINRLFLLETCRFDFYIAKAPALKLLMLTLDLIAYDFHFYSTHDTFAPLGIISEKIRFIAH